ALTRTYPRRSLFHNSPAVSKVRENRLLGGLHLQEQAMVRKFIAGDDAAHLSRTHFRSPLVFQGSGVGRQTIFLPNARPQRLINEVGGTFLDHRVGHAPQRTVDAGVLLDTPAKAPHLL